MSLDVVPPINLAWLSIWNFHSPLSCPLLKEDAVLGLSPVSSLCSAADGDKTDARCTSGAHSFPAAQLCGPFHPCGYPVGISR